MSFVALGLCKALLQIVAEQGYTKPTLIQTKAIPKILEQRDVMAVAHTGTGKTAGFTLPLIQLLSGGSRPLAHGLRALIITPTRELAAQVAQSVQNYARYMRTQTWTPTLTCIRIRTHTHMYHTNRNKYESVQVYTYTPGVHSLHTYAHLHTRTCMHELRRTQTRMHMYTPSTRTANGRNAHASIDCQHTDHSRLIHLHHRRRHRVLEVAMLHTMHVIRQVRRLKLVHMMLLLLLRLLL